MNTVSFQNKGLIDLVSIKTFGINAKDCDNPIGFFGTGLKYAIAILLRNGCNITIFRGHEQITFYLRKTEVRGKAFDIVCIHVEGEPAEQMGFTTELGKTWEMWQAFRELYCNTLDEAGETFGNAIPLQEDYTTVVVTGKAFYDEYVHRDRIMLTGSPQYVQSSVEIHDTPSRTVHYQGIRVGNFDRPCIFTYNMLANVALTEDRTVADMSDVNEQIRRAILCGDDKELIKKFLAAPKDSYEATVDLNWYDTPSEAFMEVMESIPLKNIINSSLLSFHAKHKKVVRTYCPVDALTEVEVEQLQKACDFAELLDFNVTSKLIIVTDDLRDDVLGTVLEEQIYIARRTFMQGTKMVAATLIEEFIHIDKGFADCQYPMQNFLFEKLVSLGEQLVGEAL